ncbi:MAG: carbohydrate binding family 9 domain-containing protein [Planctomycetes bacterium]|nr:carbohydrate binding family 9 domain-containing protein [Planctomycetota bacterium]
MNHRVLWVPMRHRLRLCLKTRPGFPSGLSLGVEDERPFSRLAASGCIDDKTNIACFAVFARRKNGSLSGRRRCFQAEPGNRAHPFASGVCARVILITLFCASASARAESIAKGAHDFSDRIVEASPLIGEITLDGLLNEPAWQQCVPITELYQQQPREGAPVSEKTEIRILYSSKMLYIGVLCFDREPERIIARKMRREESVRGDPIFSDDSIHIVIDPFATGQTAYMFSTNPLGARYDALIAGFNRSNYRRLSSARQATSPRPSWNGLWNVKTLRTEKGWSAEFEIPFSTLRFPNQSEQRWGINFGRRIPRKNEQAFWSAHPRDLGLYSLTHAGTLTGLADLDQGKGLDIKPYLLMNYNIEREPEHDADLLGDAGFDMAYSITSDVRLDMAVNPDFAETEVDEQPLDLERFPLFFPEKRRFFLEGSNIFSVGDSRRILPFHSRRIGIDEGGGPLPIIEGTKVTGTVKKTSFGILNALTRESDTMPMTSYNVTRVQRRVFEESNIGMLMTNKIAQGGPDNHVLGVDGSFMTHPFGDQKRMRTDFLFLQSFSDVADGDDVAGHAIAIFPNDPWDVTFEYMHVGSDFNPELGFVRQTGIDLWTYNLSYTPESNLPGLQRTAHAVRLRYSVDENYDQFRDYIQVTPIGLLFESGDYLQYEYEFEGDRVDEAFDIFRDVTIGTGHYHFGFHTIDFRSARKRPLSFVLECIKGESYNGKREAIEVDGRLQVTRHLSFSLEAALDHRDYPIVVDAEGTHGGDFTAKLTRGRATYAFTPDMYVSSFVQWENESEQFSLNNRFRWIIEPERELFVVLNFGGDRARQTVTQADLAVKLAYNWRF